MQIAKKKKNDEFFTQLADIESELRFYQSHFKNQIVYCNCDNPASSQFLKYFKLHFREFGLKGLAATHYDGTSAVHASMWGDHGYERTFYVLAATIRRKETDGRFSSSNKNWARTIPVFDSKSVDFDVQSHPTLTDAFVETARHEYLLSLPLTRNDIKAEALNILSKFQNAREPNSPNGTHYMAQISPDFLARAGTKDTDRLMAMLPFRSLAFSTLEGRKGTFALIAQDENRFQKLVLRKPSVRKKLQEQTAPAKASGPAKAKEQVR